MGEEDAERTRRYDCQVTVAMTVDLFDRIERRRRVERCTRAEIMRRALDDQLPAMVIETVEGRAVQYGDKPPAETQVVFVHEQGAIDLADAIKAARSREGYIVDRADVIREAVGRYLDRAPTVPPGTAWPDLIDKLKTTGGE